MDTIIIKGKNIIAKIRFREVTNIYLTYNRDKIIIEYNNNPLYDVVLPTEFFDYDEVIDTIQRAIEDDLQETELKELDWNSLIEMEA